MKFKKFLAILCVLSLALSVIPTVALAEDGAVTLFSGPMELTSDWEQGPQIFTALSGGTFDPARITEGSYISVTYTGTSGQVRLALQDIDAWSWNQIDIPTTTEASGDGFVSTFSYADMAAVYGTDFSDVAAVNVLAGDITGTMVITEVKWHPASGETQPPAGIQEAVLFTGPMEIKDAWGQGPQIFTSLSGGTFDPTGIVDGGCVSVYYTGPRGQVRLALQDIDAWSWNQIDMPTTTETSGDGYVSTFSYADMAAVYGTDFSNVAAINVCAGDINEPMVISKVVWGPAPAAEEPPQPTIVRTQLYSGETTVSAPWTVGPSVQVSSIGFDPGSITEGGYFTVTYTGTEGQVYLALSEWDTGLWAAVNTPASTTVSEGVYTSTFSYADCVTAYGSADFSDLDAITAGTTQSQGDTIITDISWYGIPTAVELGETEMLFTGSQTASTQGANLTFFYTKHVGGSWDASAINEGSYLYVEYTGAKDGIYLAFVSHSGAARWTAVYPDETGVDAAGRYYSLFSYDNFSKAFGTNFARLDQIQAYCAKNEEVTLKRIAYFTGEGGPVDTSDGTWDRPATGIALIGDSIVENPLVDTANLKGLDWNGILGRTNCANYGIGGQTTAELVNRIGEVAKKDYDQVVFLCGINDIGRGLTNAQIVANYETMFTALKTADPDVKLYLISVLPTTPAFYTNAQGSIAALNTELKALAERTENVTYVDCYSEFLGDDGYCKEGLTFDGLHPNLVGYDVIADILNPILGGTYTDTEPEIQDPEVPAPSEEATEPSEEAPAPAKTVTLFSGSNSAANPWTLTVEVHTISSDGTFDPSLITKGGYFTVTYTGTEGQVYLALADWDAGTWNQLDAPSSTKKVGNSYVSTFTYSDLVSVYGSDFSTVDSICVGTANSTGTTVITDLTWHAPASSGSGGASSPATGDLAPVAAAILALTALLGMAVILGRKRTIV